MDARVLAVAATLALLQIAAASGLGGTSAYAATDDALVSRDGTTFASTLDGGLFDGAQALVPGDSVSRSLWIKNNAHLPATARISVENLVTSARAFSKGVSLTSAYQIEGGSLAPGPTRTLSELSSCGVIVSMPALATGQIVKLTLTLAMSNLTNSVAQSDAASFDLMVSLRDAAAGAFPESACSDHGLVITTNPHFGRVAYTGGSIPTPLIVGGGLAIGLGAFLLVSRRRRRATRSWRSPAR